MDTNPQTQFLLMEVAKLKGENQRLRAYIGNNNLPQPPFRMPFAGEGDAPSPDSILSHCYGALLPMFTTKEATVLRQLCKEFRSTVADFPWEDDQTVIRGSVAAWRACFPRARWANVMGYRADFQEEGRMTPVVDSDFVHFVGLKRLNMSECRSITDAAFVHLKGIHTLDMYACSQDTITDAAIAHLKGIHTLKIASCGQLTDAAFIHLEGIHSLDMSWCNELTDAAFVHLQGIHTLVMAECDQPTITDAAFVHLKGVHTLRMDYCKQPTITDAAFVHLRGIHSLGLYYCRQLTSAVLTHLKGVKRLNIGHCTQLNLTDDSLKGIEWLGMQFHSQAQVDEAESFGYPVDQRYYIHV